MSAVRDPVPTLWRWDPEEALSWPLPPGPEDRWFTAGGGMCAAEDASQEDRHDRTD